MASRAHKHRSQGAQSIRFEKPYAHEGAEGAVPCLTNSRRSGPDRCDATSGFPEVGCTKHAVRCCTSENPSGAAGYTSTSDSDSPRQTHLPMNLGRIPEGFAVTGAVSTDYDVAPAAWVLEKCLCLRHITMFNWMESGGKKPVPSHVQDRRAKVRLWLMECTWHQKPRPGNRCGTMKVQRGAAVPVRTAWKVG